LRENISGRLGDMLSMLYLCSATIKQFHDNGRPMQDWPIIQWSYQNLLFKLEEAMIEIIENYPSRLTRVILKIVLLPVGRKRIKPTDRLSKKVANLLTSINCARDRIAHGLYWKKEENNNLAELEDAFKKIISCADIEKTIAVLVKENKLVSLTLLGQIEEAKEQGLITDDDYNKIFEAEIARQSVIAVDDFAQSELYPHINKPVKKTNKKSRVEA